MDTLLKPLVDFLSKTLPSADPRVQAVVTLAALAILVVLIWLVIQRSFRVRHVKLQRDEYWIKALAQERTIDELKGRLACMDELDMSLKKATEENGRLKEQVAQRENELKATAEDRDSVRSELNGLENRFESLQKLDTTVWVSAVHEPAPEFVDRHDRTATYVSFLNLKGGVGKTTTAANLAACYATGVVGHPLRVLAVDLDFQGTLSNMTVEREFLADRRTTERTAQRLIDNPLGGGEPDADLLQDLLCPMSGAGALAKVVTASDKLEHADFRYQALFAVRHCEVRFRYRQHFHSPKLCNEFDFVFFDCPPRLTTSTINAILASDYILIPTALHPNDVDAVRRTLMWLERLQRLNEYRATLAGVILNRTFRKGDAYHDLTRVEEPQFSLLNRYIREYHPAHKMLSKLIPQTPEVAKYAATSIPLGTTPCGHEIYGPFAKELYDRLKG
jgi:cellulose biosynthesis protein BcsQ